MKRPVNSAARIAFSIRAGLLGALVVLMPTVGRADAQAKAPAPQPFVGYTKYLTYHVQYDVHSDGTDIETHESALKVLAEQGVRRADRGEISFSDRLQKAEVISAYTLKSDGRRIDVPPSNFQDEANQGRHGLPPLFTDIRTMTVAFPDVAVGDTVVLKYRLVQHEPTFPGNFSLMESFSKFEAYDDVRIALSAPASLDLHVFSRGVQGGEVARKGAQRNWLWTYKNEQVAVPEQAAVSPLDYGPLVMASTFKDYAALAKAYDARARSKAAVTPAVKKLADEVSKNAHTPREQARALYEWVARNVQYAGNTVGVGAVVPHDADLVLKNRMGDCKDHTTLLQALLKAKGIDATPALIHLGNAYSLPPVASIEMFNHIVDYIPSLDMYVDSTSRLTPFGSLPLGDSDKPVVHTAHFTEIRHTPPMSYKETAWHATTVLNIHPDGSADGDSTEVTSGMWSTGARSIMEYLQPNMEDTFIRGVLQRNGYTGTGTLTKDDPQAMSPTYRYSVKYKVSDALDVPGPDATPIRSPYLGQGGVGFVLGGSQAPRTVNYQCYGAIATDEYTIQFPKNVQILAIPRDAEVQRKNLTYRAKYQLKGNTVTATREIEDRTPGNVCTPADFEEMKAFTAAVRRNVRTQVLYK